MKILINAGFFNIVPCADNNIEISLAKEFIKQGHECEIIGMTFDIEEPIVYIDGIKVIKVPYYKQLFMDARFESKKTFKTDGTKHISIKNKLMFFITHPIYAILMQLNKYAYFREKLTNDYLTEVKKILKKEHYDALIGVVFSFEQTEKLFLCPDIKLKKIYYQLDPYGLNKLYENNKNSYIVKEVNVMKHSDYVITTFELLNQYKKQEEYACVLNKMIAMDFPTFNTEVLEVQDTNPIEFDKNYINILFSGTVDDIHRNPNNCLALMDKILKRNENIRLYFLGYFYSESGKKFISDNNIAAIICPPVSYNQAIMAMRECDILLNISNEVTNMVPSKLFTYFCIGKPIINFEKIPNSPSKRFIEKYPLQFTVNEFDNNNYVDGLEKFILEKHNEHISTSDIVKVYESSTPQYVAKEMIDIMLKLIRE